MKFQQIGIVILIICSPFNVFGFTAIDLTELDFYARKGFDINYLESNFGGSRWKKIEGKSSGFRPIQVRRLNLEGVSGRIPFSLSKVDPEEFTFVTEFVLNQNELPEMGSLGLLLGTIGINWEVYLNGELVRNEVFRDESGRILLSRSLKNQIVELERRFLKPGSNRLGFRIIGDPTDPETGFYIGRPFVIDQYSKLMRQSWKPVTLILAAFYCLIGLFFLSLFSRNRNHWEYFYFGLFGVFFFIYKFSTTLSFQNLITNSAIIIRIEYAFLYLLIPCGLGFSDSLIANKLSRFSKIYSAVSLVFVFFSTWAPPAFLYDLMRVYQFTIVIPFIYLLYKLYHFGFQTKENKKPLARIFLSSKENLFLGILVCIFLGGIDIVKSLFFLTKSQISQYGFFLVSCYMGYTLIKGLNEAKERLLQSQQEIAENRRLAIENLQSADKLKDEFLANTSHELRTPIHGIMGIAESLLDQSDANSDNLLKRNMGTILSSARRLSYLIDDILDYSRLKNDDLALCLKPVDIHSIAEVCITLMKPLIQSKTLEIINKIPSDAPAVIADENRVHQVLQNLIGNAVKFTSKGTVVVDAGNSSEQLYVSVTDTGIGIDAEKIDGIFQSFEQADGTISREYGGTGLGLSITKKLVELHRGTIEVESTPGKGSTFTFSLPLADEPASVSESKPILNRIVDSSSDETAVRKTVDPEAPQILVVDDDPVNLQIVKNHLLSHSYRVDSCISGEDALHWIEDNGKPDLILLDIMMPKISGFDVCREIRISHSPGELPILFLSAKNQISDLTEGFMQGANDYLTKPFSKNELLTRVHFHLTLNRQIETGSRRLKSLRKFCSDLKSFKNNNQLTEAVYNQLTSQIDATEAVVYLNNEVIIPAHPGKQLPEFLRDKSFLRSSFQTGKDGWLLWFEVETMEGYDFLLYRAADKTDFDRADKEYISNLKTEASLVRKNIQNFIQDETTLKKYLDIQSRLQDIYFIQADRQFCKILYQDQRQLVDYDWSLGDIETYFEEKSLLRVHKSYMINPSKPIKAFKPKGSRDYTLNFTSPEIADLLPGIEGFNEIKLARTKEQKCKKAYPHWFE